MPLTFDHVTYHYGSEVQAVGAALKDVSFTIADGEYVGIIGHTGSGKSTLAEHTNGTKIPSSGTVTVDGLNSRDKKQRREMRRHVGYVMQYPEYQLFAETVRDDVAFGPRNLGLSEAEVDEAVREAIDVVGLRYDDVAEMSPFDLSGGQKRRVAMAGVIAMRPHILTVDEPMAGLDPQGRADILGIIDRLHKRGTTIVMVSHSMDDIASVAEHVIVLDHGAIADEGDPATVFSHYELLHKIGLDVPRSAHVANDLASHGFVFEGGMPLTLDALADAIAAQVPHGLAPKHGLAPNAAGMAGAPQEGGR